MRKLENLQPENVFYFFEEISNIPRGSYNTKAVSDYCVAFANERGLEVIQDEFNNVIIKKEATAGYENADPIIIQGHLDMVCEKEEGCTIDFEKDPLDLYVDGDFLKARGTTLGGDDGIAVAYALAVLDASDLQHPALEVILTTEEEVGMDGARNIDLSMIKGKTMLNIDSDEEGIFLTSCAGGLTLKSFVPVSYESAQGLSMNLKLTGLQGGHSGAEINKERGNAVLLMGRVLKTLSDSFRLQVAALAGGLKDNAIPRLCEATIVIAPEEEEAVLCLVKELEEELQKEYATSDPDLCIQCTKGTEGAVEVLDGRSFVKVLFFLRNVPNGIQNMSVDIDGLVETSLNAGIMKLEDNRFVLCSAIRSSVSSRKYDLADKVNFLVTFLGGETKIEGDYPAWEYVKDSKLRDLMVSTYEDLYQEKPLIQAIHAGLECGFLSDKIEGLDCVSFGPANFDIHTPKERLSISSTKKMWDFIVEVLKRSK